MDPKKFAKSNKLLVDDLDTKHLELSANKLAHPVKDESSVSERKERIVAPFLSERNANNNTESHSFIIPPYCEILELPKESDEKKAWSIMYNWSNGHCCIVSDSSHLLVYPQQSKAFIFAKFPKVEHDDSKLLIKTGYRSLNVTITCLSSSSMVLSMKIRVACELPCPKAGQDKHKSHSDCIYNQCDR